MLRQAQDMFAYYITDREMSILADVVVRTRL